MAGIAISAKALHQRDGGRCGLCGKPVSLARTYPHPGAATVDHIVPIAAGGRHDLANVQLAHAGCNRVKSTRPCRSQLRIFG